ncbi:DUF2164 domain-containing protein [Paenibacillus piri]|uniref:DUF2164 domain-containing protein n=1 Tax=Paenibacillus piri TaxID=2547395 RepID=A0A4R5KJZ9_9BACL|nr:DUF2164 domain-containing protein [Paenibacillus piri]TDF95155.1 DUF2164 domain-containing protein [Paenibacillus piri]
MVIAIKIPKEQKTEMIRDVQAYFEEERSESIGDLGAEQFIDYMIKVLGPHIYNQAIEDSRKLISEKMNQLDDELYTLEKPIQNWKR